MAATLGKIFRGLSNFMPKLTNYSAISANNVIQSTASPMLTGSTTCHQMSVRSYFVNWHMLKDHKRRKLVGQYYPDRMRLNCIRKNRILPREVQEIADKEIDAFPRDSNAHRLRKRCIMTSRPRGRVTRWRLSRIMWRHYADYNLMSGVTRSCW